MSRIAGLIIPKAPAGFTVTLRPSSNGYAGNSFNFIGYSLDGGTTYTDLKSTLTTDTVINNVTTIRFRAYSHWDNHSIIKVGTTDGGTQIVSQIGTAGSSYSSEITLSANTMYYIAAFYDF